MTETDILLAQLNTFQHPLAEQATTARYTETLARIRDVLHDGDVLDGHIRLVLDICQQVPGADLMVLLRQSDVAEMETLAANDAAFGLPRWQIPIDQLTEPGRLSDVHQSALQGKLPGQARPYRSLVSVPVVLDHAPRLVLIAMKAAADQYSSTDMTLLTEIGGKLGHALNRKGASHRASASKAIIEGDGAIPRQDRDADPPFETLGNAFGQPELWQSRILDLTDELLGAPHDGVDAAINRALAVLGELTESDRTYVFRLRPPDRLDNTHEWAAPGIDPMIDMLQALPDSHISDWRESFGAGLPVQIADVDDLPAGSSAVNALNMRGIRSLLAVPMRRAGQITGYLGCDAARARRQLRPGELRLLLSITNTISTLMDRHAAEAAVRAATKSLQAESRHLRATLTALPDLMLSTDHEGRFTDHNRGTNTGPLFPPEEFLGRLVEEVLPADVAEVARLVMREVDETGRSHGHEYPMQTPDGERWFAVSAGASHEARSASGYVFLIRDVTDRRKQEREIRRLSRIAELTSSFVVVTDTRGLIDWVNPAFEKRSGWQLHEVRGQKPGDILQFEGTDQSVVADIRRKLALGLPVRDELLNRSRSGEEYWIMKDIQPLYDDAARLEGFVSVQTDITAMKTSYKRDEELRNTAIETTSEGISISGVDGRFLYLNPAHRQIFGIPADQDIRNLTRDELMPAGQAAELRNVVWPLLRVEGRWQGTILGRHLDGHELDLDVVVTLTQGGEMVSVVRDVSASNRAKAERARLREDLQIAQRRETLAHVASGVAHDLNNLVAVVSGTITLMQDVSGDSGKVKQGLLRISRAMDAARDLVNGLGDLGRPDAPRTLLDLRSMIIEAVDLLGTERARRHSIHSELPSTPQFVEANRTELLQVIVNLALNACEAQDDRLNQVTLTIHPDNTLAPARTPDAGAFDRSAPYRLFSVRDTGSGIPDDLRSRLFDYYVTTKGARGTGLGLAIVASILRKCGGALWIDSTHGVGTTMTIAWRMGVSTQNQIMHGTSDDGVAIDLTGLRIMVVDDNIDVADVLSEILESKGAVTVTLSDPAEAHALLRKKPRLWSLLVTDHDMPVMTGNQLAQAAASCNPPVPCILVTAHSEKASYDSKLFAAVHTKPVDAATFLRSVHGAVRRKTKGRKLSLK